MFTLGFYKPGVKILVAFGCFVGYGYLVVKQGLLMKKRSTLKRGLQFWPAETLFLSDLLDVRPKRLALSSGSLDYMYIST